MQTAAGKTEARLDQMVEILKDPGFVQGTGRGNELAFHVFDYPPEDELLVRDRVVWLQHHLPNGAHGLNPVFLDLYEEVLDLLAAQNVLEQIPATEEKDPKGFAGVLTKLHRGPLKPENVVHHLMKKIRNEHNLVVIHGVGKVYPLVRSHSVLNNLHHPLQEKTVLLIFPGGYDQKTLQLFNKMKDDNYYRAFRLVGDL